MSKIVPTGNFFAKNFFSSYIDDIFLPTKKKEVFFIKMRLPDWPYYRPPATPETELVFSQALVTPVGLQVYGALQAGEDQYLDVDQVDCVHC